jgi:hypothetical protein
VICEGSTWFSAPHRRIQHPPKEAEYRDLFRQFEQLSLPVVVQWHGAAAA